MKPDQAPDIEPLGSSVDLNEYMVSCLISNLLGDLY